MSYKRLLWFDLETTGLDMSRDQIIEVGAVLTDTDLNEIGGWSWTIQPSHEGYTRLLSTKAVRQMHDANGLLDEIESMPIASLDEYAKRLTEVDQELNVILWNQDVKAGEVLMAGSGVGPFDRPWVRKAMPLTDSWLHYSVFDIGTLRKAWAFWSGDKNPYEVPKDNLTHRALDDVRNHLSEARGYREMMS